MYKDCSNASTTTSISSSVRLLNFNAVSSEKSFIFIASNKPVLFKTIVALATLTISVFKLVFLSLYSILVKESYTYLFIGLFPIIPNILLLYPSITLHAKAYFCKYLFSLHIFVSLSINWLLESL